jgi:hypothetical protein
MIGAVIENLIAGYLTPRRSVRRLLDGPHGMAEALLLATLAYLIGAIFAVVIPVGEHPRAGSLIGLHLLGLLLQFLSLFLVSGLVYVIGRQLGGQGSWRDAYLGVAWYSVVTSLIAPLTLPARAQVMRAVDAAGDGPVDIRLGAPLLLFLVVSGVMLWLFACYVAELHRFERTWNVLAAILGLSAVVLVVVVLIMPPS